MHTIVGLLGAVVALSRAAPQQTTRSDPPRARIPEVRLVPFAIAPPALEFGTVEVGATRSLALTLANRAHATLELRSVAFRAGESGDSAAFSLLLDGIHYAGGVATVAHEVDPPLVLARGEERTAIVAFAPTLARTDAFVLSFAADVATAEVPVTGAGAQPQDEYLHVVIDGPSFVVDHDRDGSEPLVLDGTASHTHEPGRVIGTYEWSRDGEALASTPVLTTTANVASAVHVLTIADDGTPPRSLARQHEVRLVPPDQVPGVLASYYDAAGSGATALLDDPPASADFVEQRPGLDVCGPIQVGGSPFTSDVLVRLEARISLALAGRYDFPASGGVAQLVFVDGTELVAPRMLAPGTHEIEARFAVDSLADLPLAVSMELDRVPQPIPEELLTHDETAVVPVIHALTGSGAPAGGEPVTIDGFGFFAREDVIVRWGALDLAASDFSELSPTRIVLASPPGTGTVDVSVQNASGTSAPRSFAYAPGVPPIRFRREQIVSVPAPTAGLVGPDGRLYVASLDGRITVLEFDEDYELRSRSEHAGVSALPNRETVALAIDPYDAPDPVTLYVAHGDMFLHGGEPPLGPSPYTGQISRLRGPDFSAPEPVITGLPVSNNSHSVNGMAFDDAGDLYVSIGSMTNAGVRAPGLGDLPESPLSAAVVRARLSEPGFDGAVRYVETATGLPNDDQRAGEIVDVAPGVDVEVYAAGLRNAYGLVYTTEGRLYATDNGPNVGYGPASTGPDTQAPDPGDGDELLRIEAGQYYGSPNRSRGRTDPRQNVWYGSASGPPSLPGTFTQMIAALPSSTDGIDEYRAATFGGRMRGELVVQKYLGRLRMLRLSSDGGTLEAWSTLDPITYALGCFTAPGGAIVALDQNASEVEVLEPDEPPSTGPVVHDVFPWRARATGGAPFLLSGTGFGTLADTAVTIGGAPAALAEVTPRRIRGFLPPGAPGAGRADVVVTVGGQTSTLPAAFRYLAAP